MNMPAFFKGMMLRRMNPWIVGGYLAWHNRERIKNLYGKLRDRLGKDDSSQNASSGSGNESNSVADGSRRVS